MKTTMTTTTTRRGNAVTTGTGVDVGAGKQNRNLLGILVGISLFATCNPTSLITHLTVTAGDRLTIPCHAFHELKPSGGQDPNKAPSGIVSLSWVHNVRLLAESWNSTIHTTGKYRTVNGFSLVVGVARLKDSGKYRCIKRLGDHRSESVVRVVVKDKPPKPHIPKVLDEPGSRSVNLSWPSVEEHHAGQVDYYVVQVRHIEEDWGKSMNFTARSNLALIRGLQPYRQYQFRVIAVNDVGESRPSTGSAVVKTLEELPSSPPLHMRATNTSATKILVKWDPPPLNSINGELKGFVVRYKALQTIKGPLRETPINNVEAKEHLIHDLEVYTNYLVQVAARNGLGNGPWASATCFTGESLPGRPEVASFREITHSRFRVTWNPPERKNGVLTAYRVHVYHDGLLAAAETVHLSSSTSTSGARDANEDGRGAIRLVGGTPSALVRGLRPFTEYMVTVSAATSRGFGPESSPAQRVQTDVRAPGAPVNVTIVEQNDDMIKVAWDEPLDVVNTIDRYWIHCFSPSTNENLWKEVNCDEEARRRKLRGVFAGDAALVDDAGDPARPLGLRGPGGGWPRRCRDGAGERVRARDGLERVRAMDMDEVELMKRRPTTTTTTEAPCEEEEEEMTSDGLGFVHVTPSGSKFVDYCSGRAVITGLNPETDYEVKIAAATRSVVYPEKFHRGVFSLPAVARLRGGVENGVGGSVRDFDSGAAVGEGGGAVLVEPAGPEPGMAADGTFSPGVMAGIVISTLMMVFLLLFLAVFRRYCDGDACIAGKSRSLGGGDDSASAAADTTYDLNPKTKIRVKSGLSNLGSGFGSGLATPTPTGGPGHHTPSVRESQIITTNEEKAIPVEEFGEYVHRQHLDDNLGFAEDYDEICCQVAADLTFYASTDPTNKDKNRYLNIMAYDHSRVVLGGGQGAGGKSVASTKHSGVGVGSGGDYINANFVDGYCKPRAYIATQGPIPSTFEDFWRMVYENNSTVIVMVTNLVERGRLKCHQYWPGEVNTTIQYGCMLVRSLSVSKLATHTVRVFAVRHTKQKKKQETLVQQFHYTEWPDHGVPSHALPLLAFVRKSANANPEGSGPIVIHCSAGVGRTGTYICMDVALRQIEAEGVVNIKGFLKQIRQQRNYLVQTEEQYVFIHDAILEAIQSGTTHIPVERVGEFIHLHLLEKNAALNGMSLLQHQFELITSYRPKEYKYTSARKNCNQYKNREVAAASTPTEDSDSGVVYIQGGVLPIEHTRVPLIPKPAVDGSDYINASFLQGFNDRNEFIVTQHPLDDTIGDFWRLVWDYNIRTVVMLSQVDPQAGFPAFWPEKGDKLQYESFTVELKEEIHHLNCIFRDVQLESGEEEDGLFVRIVYSSYWPESCTPLSTCYELIHTVRQHHGGVGEGPIVVLDKFGATEAGWFCALFTLWDQLQQDEFVDVYQIAKLYHYQRPGLWRSKDDYHFLWQAIETQSENLRSSSSVATSSATPQVPGALPAGMTPSPAATAPPPPSLRPAPTRVSSWAGHHPTPPAGNTGANGADPRADTAHASSTNAASASVAAASARRRSTRLSCPALPPPPATPHTPHRTPQAHRLDSPGHALPTIPDIDSDGRVIVEQRGSRVREQLAVDGEDADAKKSGYDTM